LRLQWTAWRVASRGTTAQVSER